MILPHNISEQLHVIRANNTLVDYKLNKCMRAQWRASSYLHVLPVTEWASSRIFSFLPPLKTSLGESATLNCPRCEWMNERTNESPNEFTDSFVHSFIRSFMNCDELGYSRDCIPTWRTVFPGKALDLPCWRRMNENWLIVPPIRSGQRGGRPHIRWTALRKSGAPSEKW